MSYLLDENTVLLLKGEDTTDYFGNVESISGVEIIKEGKFKGAFKGINTSAYGIVTFKDKISSFFPNPKIFTVDFWFKIDWLRNGDKYLFRPKGGSSSFLTVGMYCANNQWYLQVNGVNVSGYIDYVEGWHHVAVQSDGSTTSVYFDGVKQTAKAPANRPLFSSSDSTWEFIRSDAATSTNPECYVYIDELRISNCVRYTDDFTPNNRPYGNPTHPNILNSTELLCTIINEMVLDRLEVYINNVLDKTYNSLNANSVTIHRYNLDLLESENNLIKVVSYKDNVDYPVEFEYKYLPPLSSLASLNTIINRLQSLLERQENENSIFRSILKEKGVTDDLEGLRYEDLMEYVRLLGDYTPPTDDIVESITITGVTENFSTAYIQVSGGLIDDEIVELYIDGVLNGSYYYRTGQVQTISSSRLLNTTIQLKTTDGRISNKYYVDTIN